MTIEGKICLDTFSENPSRAFRAGPKIIEPLPVRPNKNVRFLSDVKFLSIEKMSDKIKLHETAIFLKFPDIDRKMTFY
jgi:hypothetical protein